MEQSLGIIFASRGRPEILLDCLTQLSKFEKASILEVVVAIDDDPESMATALAFERKDDFFVYTVVATPGRLYTIRAYNFALENCHAEQFCWIGDDAIFPEIDWISLMLEDFAKTFPDGLGIMGMGAHGPGLGMASKSFIQYNDGEFYHPGYTIHYSDIELGMRAVMLGRYSYFHQGIGHQKYLLETRPPMDLGERYVFIKQDKKLYSERRRYNFYLDEKKIINPIDFSKDFHYPQICLPLPKIEI